jgi:hypothetical protein
MQRYEKILRYANFGAQKCKKNAKNAKIVLSAPSRHNGRKIPAYNAGETDGDKRDLGIAGQRYPEGELCRYGGLAPNVASTGLKNVHIQFGRD